MSSNLTKSVSLPVSFDLFYLFGSVLYQHLVILLKKLQSNKKTSGSFTLVPIQSAEDSGFEAVVLNKDLCLQFNSLHCNMIFCKHFYVL